MKLYKFFHFCAKQKRMCNSFVSFFNLREAALSIIFYHKIINFKPPVNLCHEVLSGVRRGRGHG